MNCPQEELEPAQQKELEEFLLTSDDVFSLDEDELGHTSLVHHTVDTGDHQPIKQPPRRLPCGAAEVMSMRMHCPAIQFLQNELEASVLALQSLDDATELRRTELMEEQLKDPELAAVGHFVKEGVVHDNQALAKRLAVEGTQ